MDDAYYYQIQMQMAITEKSTCYLVVWTKQNLEIIKVPFNESFWEEKKEAENFFYQVLLPELIFHSIYTRTY